MPIIDIPFKRVAIDIVGEIFPASSREHRYILTVLDFATHYPEAVALKNITTTNVTEALVSIFARVGVPEEKYLLRYSHSGEDGPTGEPSSPVT